MVIGPIAFGVPWLLAALVALPVLWFILRAVPPAPVRRMFPGVTLLVGLKDDENVTDRTPWWLLLLRMLAVAAVIIGLAAPVLNPNDKAATTSADKMLIVMDASWASARTWEARQSMASAALNDASRAGQLVAVVRLSAPEAPVFRAADEWQARLGSLTPTAWEPVPETMQALADGLGEGAIETRWFSDGIARSGRDALLSALKARGAVTIHETPVPIFALRPASTQDGAIELSANRLHPGPERTIEVEAHGTDPNGLPRRLATLPLTFAEGETEASGALSLPAELSARLTRFAITGQPHAGAVTLTDDRLKRREVALIAGREDREGLELLSPLHYLQKALALNATLLDGALLDILPANPDVIILADVATLSDAETAAVLDWLEGGGLLLRFAGTRLAASETSRTAEDPLMPVRLRAGGRMVGGAMSWGEPKALSPFAKDSPFYGLTVPEGVTVSAQVMAQPDPTLADRVIAQLTDGTPLVTRKPVGQGQVVLFHVTANAEWSSLPLSGLFVQMLERLTVLSSAALPSLEEMQGTTWQPVQVLNGFGTLQDAGNLPGVAGEAMVTAATGPELQPGLYDGTDRRLALNVFAPDRTLLPTAWPAGTRIIGLQSRAEFPLGGWLLALALGLLMVDILASLSVSGRLMPLRAASVVLAVALIPDGGFAQDLTPEEKLQLATSGIVLAHVITGDSALDNAARAGLVGLGNALFLRTSVEPDAPISVDLERDDLAVYPLLYWPVTPDQPIPSDEAYARLNTYLRSGGMIVFDTRDANVAGFGAASPNGKKLQRLAAPLDIPPLEQVPQDHVLTRTFYLLQTFPGRHMGRGLWVEAAPPDAEKIEGMPFRNLNDNVSPVIIGGNDWASAWAVDARGAPMFPVGRGYAGERQREVSYRFGVNLVLYVLTGNYKSDQVHVPALLNRLGQ